MDGRRRTDEEAVSLRIAKSTLHTGFWLGREFRKWDATHSGGASYAY